MPNYAKVEEIKFLHHEEEINEYLKKNGWIIIVPPFVGLRRINSGQDGNYAPVDIPFRQVILGKMKGS